MGEIADPLARQPERQGDIVEGRQMIQQPEILEHHPDAAAEGRQVAAPGGGQFGAEQGDQAPAGRLGDIDQLQQRGLARARKAGQEGERARLQRETDIAQHFGARAIAHADIFKANHGGEHNRRRRLRSWPPTPIFR